MILCCGEALIDMLPRETTQGEEAFAPYPGGAVFNTAIALGRLAAEPGFLCGLSRDAFGAMLEASLREANVDPSLSPRSDRLTTLAFVRLTNGQASYQFYDENTALSGMTIDDIKPLPGNVDALFFGGISLVGATCGPAFEALMLREADSHVTMIDPNIRESFITDRDTYVARIGKMMAAADIVKLSDEDLMWLEGDGDYGDLARGILARGTKLVIITRGAEGATAYMANHEVSAPAETVLLVDTVGAGDTFNAGVLFALQQSGSLTKEAIKTLDAGNLRKALEMGARCAAVTVSRAGANPPWAHEI